MAPEVAVERQFSVERLSRLARLERGHFWFVGRRELVKRLLRKYLGKKGRLVLDLGCGTGLMLEILIRQGHRVVGLDRLRQGLYATRQALPVSWLLQAEATQLPFQENVFDTVLLLDVLEHADDRALLAEIQRVLQAGGWAVIAVPAMPWLWSYRDAAAGHLRRYTRQQLLRVLTDAQLQVQETHYYQCLLFPLLVLSRLFGRRSPRLRDFEEQPPRILNAVMTWMNRLETRLSDTIPWPWGSSLVVICRKMPA